MKIKCNVFIATSIDGFIARPDGRIDWLEEFNRKIPQGEDCGYQEFYSKSDCLILGRRTFEKVMTFPQWPFGDKPVVVASRQPKPPNHSLPAGVTLSSEEPIQLLSRLAQSGLKSAYVDGGELIQTYLRLNLINSITITRIPILLGEGRRLFGHLEREIKLELISSRNWPFGFVQDFYRVLR